MPLVDPVTQGNDWTMKLMGKKLGDKSDHETFAKSDLPENHRIITPDTMATLDFKPERTNIHVDKDGAVHKVTQG